MNSPNTAEINNALLRLKARNEKQRLEFIKLPLYKKIYRIMKDKIYMSYLYWFDYDRYKKYVNLGKLVEDLNKRQLT